MCVCVCVKKRFHICENFCQIIWQYFGQTGIITICITGYNARLNMLVRDVKLPCCVICLLNYRGIYGTYYRIIVKFIIKFKLALDFSWSSEAVDSRCVFIECWLLTNQRKWGRVDFIIIVNFVDEDTAKKREGSVAEIKTNLSPQNRPVEDNIYAFIAFTRENYLDVSGWKGSNC